MRYPRDSFPYPRDPRSRPIDSSLADGLYVYVQHTKGTVYVVPDGPHLHPRVLGSAQPALYAGDLTVNNGIVTDLTNLSGTFECDDPNGLLAVARQIRAGGVTIADGAIRFFPPDGSRPIVLE